jgi:hypothetical protein
MARIQSRWPDHPGPHRFWDLAQDSKAEHPLDVQVIRLPAGLAVQFEPGGELHPVSELAAPYFEAR